VTISITPVDSSFKYSTTLKYACKNIHVIHLIQDDTCFTRATTRNIPILLASSVSLFSTKLKYKKYFKRPEIKQRFSFERPVK
jgi:hypothetical protein